MKKARFLFVMILLAVLVDGASLGAQSSQVREQTAATSDDKSANSAPAGNNDTQARGEKNQTAEYSSSNNNRKSFAAAKAGIHRPAISQAKSSQGRQLRSPKTPAAKDLPTELPQNVRDPHLPGPTLSSNVPDKTVRHSSPRPPSSTVALNGQQFKNSRDPRARMVSSGGPANSMRGTAVINGSDMKRKP
jgi:hypothetical protein